MPWCALQRGGPVPHLGQPPARHTRALQGRRGQDGGRPGEAVSDRDGGWQGGLGVLQAQAEPLLPPGSRRGRSTAGGGPTTMTPTSTTSTRGTPSSTRRPRGSTGNTRPRSNRTWRGARPCEPGTAETKHRQTEPGEGQSCESLGQSTQNLPGTAHSWLLCCSSHTNLNCIRSRL